MCVPMHVCVHSTLAILCVRGRYSTSALPETDILHALGGRGQEWMKCVEWQKATYEEKICIASIALSSPYDEEYGKKPTHDGAASKGQRSLRLATGRTAKENPFSIASLSLSFSQEQKQEIAPRVPPKRNRYFTEMQRFFSSPIAIFLPPFSHHWPLFRISTHPEGVPVPLPAA